MGEEKRNYSDDKGFQHQAESCPRSYKPWIWTLILMALLTLIWSLFENYQEGGVVKTIFESDDYQAAARQNIPGVYSTGGATTPADGAPLMGPQGTFHGIIERVRPGVISIDANIGETMAALQGNAAPAAGAPNAKFTRVGSGIIVDPKGFAISSLHVVAGATALQATTYDPKGAKTYKVKVVNVDKTTDLVLLRLLGVGPFPYAVLGDSDAVRTGDMVLALGSPYGFDHTVTTGIISSRNRTLNIGGKIYDGVLQTDTPINRGNSGGPLVNTAGEVIGVNTAIYSPTGTFSGIGFAIPVNKASTLVAGVVDFRNSVTQVAGGQVARWGRAGRQSGNTYRMAGGQIVTPPHAYRGRCTECHPQLLNPPITPNQIKPGLALPVAGNTQTGTPFIGASLLDIDPVLAKQFNLLHAGGVLVDRVYPGAPADGLLVRGDIIMRADGRRMLDVKSFRKHLRSKKIGKSFDLVLMRNGSRKTVKVRTTVTPDFLPGPQMAQVKEFNWFGSEISPLRAAIKPFVKTGVYVTDADGILRAAGVMRGDVIKAVNKEMVRDMNSFINIANRVSIRDGFVLDIIRGGSPMYVVVKG